MYTTNARSPLPMNCITELMAPLVQLRLFRYDLSWLPFFVLRPTQGSYPRLMKVAEQSAAVAHHRPVPV